MLLLLMVVEHGRAACCRCPVLEACLVAGPGHVKVAAAEVDARTAVVQLHGVRPEHPFVEEACVEGRVRELCAQVRQALGLAEVRRLLVHRRLPMLAAAAGVRRLLAHAEVARVALQRRARRATDVPVRRTACSSVRTVQFRRAWQVTE